MQHIIIAFAKDSVSEKMKKMISACGKSVYASCRSKAELMRSVRDLDDVLIITSFKLPDATCDEIAEDTQSQIIAVIKPEENGYINNEDIFKLFLPVNTAMVKEAIDVLSKHFKTKERSPEDKKLIENAKIYLMEKFMMDEDAAYRFIQKQSMNKGYTMPETAKVILRNSD